MNKKTGGILGGKSTRTRPAARTQEDPNAFGIINKQKTRILDEIAQGTPRRNLHQYPIAAICGLPLWGTGYYISHWIIYHSISSANWAAASR